MKSQSTVWVKVAGLVLNGILLLSILFSCGNPINGNTDNHVYGSVTDIDGNVYKTIQIGNQEWMAENLRTTKYNDGTAIPHVADSASWIALAAPGYCYHNNTTDADSIRKFGALYNWYVVETNKLAPAGWHVPTDAEWTTLENFLIDSGYNWDGTKTGNKIAKALAAETDWHTDPGSGAIGNDLTKNNKSGFSALPGACRNYGLVSGSSFPSLGYNGYWWSATQFDAWNAYTRQLCSGLGDLRRYSFDNCGGLSVRLVKD
jgi:uncharacterized protein (TIGR02145 family)